MKFNLFTAVSFFAFAMSPALGSPVASLGEASGELSDLLARADADASTVQFTEDHRDALTKTFGAILAIPDSVLQQGDDAMDKWLVANGYRSNSTVKRSPEPEAWPAVDTEDGGQKLHARSWWTVIKCIGAIVQLIATTAVPAARILKIKKYIQELGGVKDAVELLLKATTRAEKLKLGGQALLGLALEISGISSITNNCF